MDVNETLSPRETAALLPWEHGAKAQGGPAGAHSWEMQEICFFTTGFLRD